MKTKKCYFWPFVFSLVCTANAVTASTDDHSYGPIYFKSSKLAQWQLKSQYRIHSVSEAHQYDSSFTYATGSLSSVSAKRQFATRLPQSIYATYRTNNTAFQHYAEWLYLPNDIGTFTRLGWLLGHNDGLNMAIELEHRQIGEEENMALSLGVHYLF